MAPKFGAKQLPITYGDLTDFPKDPLACMRKLHQEHGELAILEDGDQQVVFVFGPELNQQVLSDMKTFHSRFFVIRGPKKSAQRRLTSGLLSMNEQTHRRNRRMVARPFQKNSFVSYHEPLVELAKSTLDTWKVGETRDIHTEMVEYMLRVTSTMLFGFDVPDLALEIGRMLDRWVAMNHEVGIGALVSNHQSRDSYQELIDYAEKLEARIREMIKLRQSGKPGTDVLSLMLRAHDERGSLSEDALIGHTALVFGAAHLTTAHTFTWTMLLLAQHPSVMREVRKELNAVPQEEITVYGRDEMPVLERVIKESMRVLPASSYSQRIVNLPVELGGIQFKPGTPVIFSQFITHHMESLFEEPERFIPSRWETIQPSPYAYLPFATGPRMCLGGPLASMILRITLPMILRKFNLQIEPNAEINGKVISTMLNPTSSVPMRLLDPSTEPKASFIRGNIHQMVDLVEMPTTLN
ncbi:Pentalenene oxygenase [Planctomycetales bacterium 10988]|nr:Pentalenene oxygenase [Planctomycetales bacterium 10988]